MSYFSNISSAITTLVDGMKVTMGYFVRPREHVTLQYPDEVWPIPTRNIGVGEIERLRRSVNGFESMSRFVRVLVN